MVTTQTYTDGSASWGCKRPSQNSPPLGLESAVSPGLPSSVLDSANFLSQRSKGFEFLSTDQGGAWLRRFLRPCWIPRGMLP
ncbi:hypothetical protein N7450_011210 [Penicillium hetheringtonii]|uniref:Uncharacterized protein n=1 Tax=Penicillium hetheringtonii TaxID=911720 RepID=A0AAD6DBN4_9EURO|nr:hypothetical protein N7450_011210 [Penicillium hetheringtonii]